MNSITHTWKLSFLAVMTALSMTQAQDKKQPFALSGLYLEGCSCSLPCPCELVGVADACDGVGVVVLDSGNYGGQDLAGAKIAYATAPGKWVRLYIDAPNPAVRKTAEAFARTAYSGFGPIESVQDAEIKVTGKGGKYTLNVNGGKTMKLTTEPVLGGDQKTPITISNTKSGVSPVFLQARTLSGSFNDGGKSFALKNSNSYFNDKLNSKSER